MEQYRALREAGRLLMLYFYAAEFFLLKRVAAFNQDALVDIVALDSANSEEEILDAGHVLSNQLSELESTLGAPELEIGYCLGGTLRSRRNCRLVLRDGCDRIRSLLRRREDTDADKRFEIVRWCVELGGALLICEVPFESVSKDPQTADPAIAASFRRAVDCAQHSSDPQPSLAVETIRTDLRYLQTAISRANSEESDSVRRLIDVPRQTLRALTKRIRC